MYKQILRIYIITIAFIYIFRKNTFLIHSNKRTANILQKPTLHEKIK